VQLSTKFVENLARHSCDVAAGKTENGRNWKI